MSKLRCPECECESFYVFDSLYAECRRCGYVTTINEVDKVKLEGRY